MSEPPFLSALSSIAGAYDALLCDAWGVIHNGVELFDGAAEALTKFRAERGPVIILTNAPRPSSIIPAQLDRLGLPRACYDSVVTSGDATRAAIAARLPALCYRLGPAKDNALTEELGVEFAPLARAGFILCTGLVDDQTENPESYRPLLEEAQGLALPMICANPDKIVRWGGRLVWCAGALAEIYEELGGDVIYGGKPHAPIYDLACAAVDEARGAPTDRKRILAVGDGLATDILGANRQGIDVVFVAGAGGVHEGAHADADEDQGAARRALAGAGARAAAIMEGFYW